jgi:aconitate hydratase
MLPFTLEAGATFDATPGDWVYVPNIRVVIERGATSFPAKLIRSGGEVSELTLHLASLTADEREIILAGCLMNFYAQKLRA